jgi:NAD(P)-dependent dehydrogenase (short-subunit alcohol dehydrogenase family)
MRFNLKDKVVVITGGGGFLGGKHAEAVAEIEGIPVLVDIDEKNAMEKAKALEKEYGVPAIAYKADITSIKEIKKFTDDLIKKFGKIDVLINNAAMNPQMDYKSEREETRLENFSLERWNAEVEVGLTGAFLCSKIIGPHMAKKGEGVILNIASDLGLIAPDQRIYKKKGLSEDMQPVKPVTYTVVKHGLIGLTRYLATYWCDKGVRVNALCPGGIYNNQPEDFVKKLTDLIPLGRMANPDDYKGAIQFMCSDASIYMNGSIVSIDGGRTCW